MDHTTSGIDYDALKTATIETSELTTKQKMNAHTTFDSCISTPWDLPYPMYRVGEEMLSSQYTFLLSQVLVSFLMDAWLTTAKMNEFISVSNRVYRVGRLIPSKSMVSVNCIMTALLQNVS